MYPEIRMPQPDDWHCHLRDHPYLARTVPDTSAHFGRAIVMPNLTHPLITTEKVVAYYHRIQQHVPTAQADFQPLMTVYLTESMKTDELITAKRSGIVVACKLYPAGVTTHSAAGVSHLTNIYPLLETMEKLDLILLIHGEVIDASIDIFDREAVFIDQHLIPLVKRFPHLRIVLEHISTQTAVDFITNNTGKIAATITPHHLLLTRTQLLSGGIHPHYYCLPVVKSEEDREALITAATSGDTHFFLGTDSAPHEQSQKETASGCAGIYNTPTALAIYADIFHQKQALPQLPLFASINGPCFYGLPIHKKEITLIQKKWHVPQTYSFGDGKVVPLAAGETLNWQVQ